MATDAGLRLWRCLCGPLLSFRLSFAVHVCTIVSRETEKERDFSGTTYVQNGVSGRMGLRAIIGFATANRPLALCRRAH